MGPRPVWSFGEEQNLFLRQDSNPNLPARSLGTTMNTLFQLLLFYYFNNLVVFIKQLYFLNSLLSLIVLQALLTPSSAQITVFHCTEIFNSSSFLSKCFDSSLKYVCVVDILWFVPCTVPKQTGNISREVKSHE